MAAENPFTSVSCDDKNTILAFRPSKFKQLGMEEVIIREKENPLLVTYKQLGTNEGLISNPGCLTAVKSRGLVTAYGVVEVINLDRSTSKNLAQLSPVAMLLENDDGLVPMNPENLSVAATCDGGSKVYLFTIEKDDFTYDIQQVMMNFQDGGRPQVTMARAEQKPVQKSRLAVVTEATASRRWIFYEGANRTLFAFKYPEMKEETVVSEYVNTSTPLAATIAKVGEKQILCLYYLASETLKLKRTTKDLSISGAKWTPAVDVAAESEGKKVSATSELSVTTFGNTNWVFFIEKGNKSYNMPTHDVVV